ncbi:hypothetical protein CYMTET_51110 [Cymbomonas tetramitiformis]|uniref:Uncharacterized protein n=1 Tax=Cymbomonas tetramitiformis TaxID=36881 RepID=A0AAE0BMX7_9CHLO|nr:hypothetical protein CYMTET_51110 [Cymbomonas tetramitiformis]
MEPSEHEKKPELSQSREDQLSLLLVKQMEMMEVISRRLADSEQKQVVSVKSSETLITCENASKVVQSVLKSLGTISKYSGNERNQYEAWTRFSTQLQSAVVFYPDLRELVSNEESLSDVANLKDLADMTPGTNPFADDTRSPQSIVTVEGSSTTASAVLSAVLVQVTEKDAFDLVRRCENDGLKAYRKLRARVEPQLFGQLAAAMNRLTRLTVNSTSDPVKQLSAYADLQSSVCRYGGEQLDRRTIEVVTLAFVVSALPVEYATMVADLGREAKPTFDLLQQRCDFFYVNVLQERNPSRDYVAAAEDTDTAAVAKSLLGDRRRQSEEKKVNDSKHLVCAVCTGGHSSETCWLMHPQKMEEFIKKNPARGAQIRERYEKRKKRMLESKTPEAVEKVAAAVTTEKMTEEEIWEAEEHDEVPCACLAVQNCGDQLGVYIGDVLNDSWVYGVAESEGDLADLQRELALQPSMAASTVETVQQRVLHYDSMATRNAFNDLSFFEGGTVCAKKAVKFKVMAGEVTASKGAGMVLINLWNYATGKVDVLYVEAQYVPDSPFNLMSAVCLEDKYDLYGQLLHRELVSTNGKSRYKVVRDGRIFILPEFVETEAACPTVQEKVFRDVVNWKFTEFSRWNTEKGPFSVDMCADKHNAQLQEYYSVEDSVFDHTLTGRAFYANMPYVDTFIARLLVKIFTDFAKDPEHTKFLLVLPHKPHAVWWGLTRKLEELQTYSKGSVIFSAAKEQCYRVEELTESEPGRVWIRGTPWAVTVFYLDQFTVGRIDAKVLAHLRLGHICDKYIDVMDLRGMNLGVSSEELRESKVTKCSEQCMSCQVAKPTRPSQVMDRGRVPKSVRKVVKRRQTSTRLGQLTFTDHGGPFVISRGGSRGYTLHVDDYSGLGCIYIWKRKLEYLTAL